MTWGTDDLSWESEPDDDADVGEPTWLDPVASCDVHDWRRVDTIELDPEQVGEETARLYQTALYECADCPAERWERERRDEPV